MFEAFGKRKFQPADSLLRIFVPKQEHKLNLIIRTSAIWALGKIWKGRNDSGLEQELATRLLDNNPLLPEEPTVQYASAIALGMIGNPQILGRVRSCQDRPPDPLGLARQWAIDRLTKTGAAAEP